jgi:hypothetical protein
LTAVDTRMEKESWTMDVMVAMFVSLASEGVTVWTRGGWEKG